jgi:glycosyltransferase involved in cell wall biosynthesis
MKTLHVLGLPHTVTAEDSSCETTQKIFRFCKMFENHPEYRVIHYGHNRSSTSAAEQVNVTSDEVLSSTYGAVHGAENKEYYDLAHRVFRSNAIREIRKKKQKGDFLLAFNIEAKGVADEVNVDGDVLVVEPSVTSAEAFSFLRCYESYPLKAAFAGTEGVSKEEPRWYWRVVPRSFDLGNYRNREKENWAIYIVDSSNPWGLSQAVQACERVGMKLKVCGTVDLATLGATEWPENVEYLGDISFATKVELLSKAYCGFLMSLRWEPFGPTVIEMMLSGCVPITADLGAMTESIVDGLNGFRCNSLRDMVRAIQHTKNIDRRRMMTFAAENFSTDAVRAKYLRAFSDFELVLNGEGWFDKSEATEQVSLGLNYRSLYV